jgi:hypothetical protein
MSEFDTEPVRGLPERLPKGETMLWQGEPEWKALARDALHVRKFAVYFLLLTSWNGLSSLQAGHTTAEAAVSATWGLGLGVAACSLLTLFAWLVGRSTVYTITSKRVVMRYGIALPMTVNYPFALVEGAGLRGHADGTGDIPLAMQKGSRLSYLVMWPHARPWRIGKPEPMMRSIPDAERVARILGRALAAAAAQPATATADIAGLVAGARPQAAAVA